MKSEAEMLRGLYSLADADQRLILERFFPELRENEDERIKKDILVVLEKAATKFFKEEGKMPVWYDGAILWLEKQGKREYALKSFKDEDVHKFMQYFEKQAKVYEIELPNRSYDIFGLAKDILTWLENQDEQEDIITNQADYVDLGLPSGTLWAKCNLGAKKESDFGLYYQWGDTQGYAGVDEHQFSWGDYKWDDKVDLTKYNDTDKKLVLDNEDDPVFVATNGMFKSPTKKQMQELIKHTDHKWTEIDGVKGMKFINKNDSTKYIFIPAAGYCSAGGYYSVGDWGYIWSVNRDGYYENYAWSMGFYAGNVHIPSNYRSCGFSVRGVMNK